MAPVVLPSTPPQLAAYRTRHVIAVEQTLEGSVCRVDRIRVFRRRSGQRPLLWRHDPTTVAALARQERGEL